MLRFLHRPGWAALLVLALVVAAPPARAEDEPDELSNLVLRYEGAQLEPVVSGQAVTVTVRPFEDLREDKKIAGRSATYSIFHVKGTHDQYDTPDGFLEFISSSVGQDLEKMGLRPGATAGPPEAGTTPAERLRREAQGGEAGPVDSGLTVTGQITRFYGEVVTNTWAWPFVGKTAQGEVKLKLRVLDTASGEILAEAEAEGQSEVGGGPDRVNAELNTAFAKAMQAAWTPQVQELLRTRALRAVEEGKARVARRQAELRDLAALPVTQVLPAPSYAGVPLAALKSAAVDPEWQGALEQGLSAWFGPGFQPADECNRLARSCSYSFQNAKAAGERILLVTTVPAEEPLESVASVFETRVLPWLSLQPVPCDSYGLAVTRLPGGGRLVALVVQSGGTPPTDAPPTSAAPAETP